jgi:hypothetical protein
MEMAFPEDWPVILHNFARALHAHGLLYLTVEITTKEDLDTAYEAGQRLGLPLIYGEYAHHGGYHYYPNDEQVRTWLAETQFTLLDATEGDEYRHYLIRYGSNERDSSSPTARSSPVMLSEAKHLSANRDRPFAEFTLERSEGLRVTRCDCSHGQGPFFTIEPCLRKENG